MTEQYIRYAAMFIIIMMAVIDDYRRFKVSNRIIIAGMVIGDSGDYIENCRFNNLKRYFIESGKEAIVDRMMRINLKMKDTMDEGFLKRIMYTDAYGYVSSLLDMV